MLENTIHSIVGLARAEKALFTVTGISLGPFLHIDPILVAMCVMSPVYQVYVVLLGRN